jgi:hypothetical protein
MLNRAFFLFVGVVVEYIVSYAFDYALYPFVILKYGLLKGGAIMSVLSLILCYSTLVVYDLLKKDWFGIELIKELREYEGRIKTFGIMAWLLKKGQLVSFIVFSLKFDPFTTVIYMRKGANKFTGMDRKSWIIFFGSWAVGNFCWIIIVSTGISVAKLLWEIAY